MKVEMEFEGLEELIKAFEKAASDEDIKDTIVFSSPVCRAVYFSLVARL